MAGWCSRTVVIGFVSALAFAAGTPPAFGFGDPLPYAPRNTSAVFAPWLDPSQYFLLANGGFEQGAHDWDLTGNAAVVAGNESFSVNGPADSQHLSLRSGGAAESRTAALGLAEPTVRLFVKAPPVVGARLQIDATVVNPTTGLTIETHFVVLGGSAPTGWAPTPPIVIPNVVGGLLPADLTLRMSADCARAEWGIDDVYVDPFRQR